MKNVMSVTSVFIVLALSSPRLAGQVIISAIAKDLQPIEKSSEVKVIRFGSFEEEDAVAIKGKETILNAGDEVRCASDKISVELTKNDGTSATLSQPFRIVVLPGASSGGRFWINLLKGSVQVVSERPTSVTSGETTLGSQRTRYGVRIERDDRQLKTEISVYEGRISVGRPRTRPLVVETGKKTVLRKAESQIVQLEKADFKRAAAVYATIDTVKSKVAGQPPQARRKAYEELETRYINVLQEPNNPVNHRNLAVAQLNLIVPARALYSLNRAAPPEPKPKEAAVVDVLKSIAYNQLGNNIEANRFRKMAVEKDPSVNTTPNLKLYKIDPVLIKNLKLISPQPIIVRALTRPSKVAPKEETRIIVRALTKDGKPISNADVVISAGGGTFAGINKYKISGQTDAKGDFTARWWCEPPCAAAYVFYVEVSKPGFKKAINEKAKVEIKR